MKNLALTYNKMYQNQTSNHFFPKVLLNLKMIFLFDFELIKVVVIVRKCGSASQINTERSLHIKTMYSLIAHRSVAKGGFGGGGALPPNNLAEP